MTLIRILQSLLLFILLYCTNATIKFEHSSQEQEELKNQNNSEVLSRWKLSETFKKSVESFAKDVSKHKLFKPIVVGSAVSILLPVVVSGGLYTLGFTAIGINAMIFPIDKYEKQNISPVTL